MCIHTYIYVCEEYIYIHVHPYTHMNYIIYMNMCVHTYMYLYHLLITLNDYQVIQNPCSLNYTLADIVPFDLKQEEGTPYGWRRSVSLTETHSPPLPKPQLSTVSQGADKIHWSSAHRAASCKLIYPQKNSTFPLLWRSSPPHTHNEALGCSVR